MKRLVLLALLASGCASMPGEPVMIEGPQGRLRVSDGGRGPAVPVLFIHGNGANLDQWHAQLTHVRKSRRAVAFDLRGMGHSNVPVDGDYSIESMHADLEAVANHFKLNRFVLVGHSYAGAVIAPYAAAHPERVAGVVYADAVGDFRITDAQAEKYYEMLRMDKPGVVRQGMAPILENARPAVQEAVLRSIDRTSTETFVEALDGMRKADVAGAVAAYRGPMVAIVAAGNRSPTAFHVQFPHVPTREIEGVSHWLMMDKPAEFNRVLDEFLVKVR